MDTSHQTNELNLVTTYKLLPIHPQPAKDELLSSWLTRLSVANGFCLHQFVNCVLGYKGATWNRDIDKYLPKPLLIALLKSTGQPKEVIRKLTLNSYTNTLFLKCNRYGSSPWILPICINHRKRTGPALQFCPHCLAEDKEPYFRKYWRLSLFAMCPKHYCLLSNSCPSCNEPITFYRNYMGDKNTLPKYSITQCSACHFDLKASPENSLVNYIPSANLDAYVDLLNNFLNEHWYYPQCSNVFPHAFFDGLRILLSVIKSKRIKKLHSKISKNFNFDIKSYVDSKNKTIEFNQNSIEQRLELLTFISYIISSWPNTFASIGFKRSMFTDHYDELPFWIDKALHSS